MADAARADASHEEHDGKFQLPFAPTPPRRPLPPGRDGDPRAATQLTLLARTHRARTRGVRAWGPSTIWARRLPWRAKFRRTEAPGRNPLCSFKLVSYVADKFRALRAVLPNGVLRVVPIITAEAPLISQDPQILMSVCRLKGSAPFSSCMYFSVRCILYGRTQKCHNVWLRPKRMLVGKECLDLEVQTWHPNSGKQTSLGDDAARTVFYVALHTV